MLVWDYCLRSGKQYIKSSCPGFGVNLLVASHKPVYVVLCPAGPAMYETLPMEPRTPAVPGGRVFFIQISFLLAVSRYVHIGVYVVPCVSQDNIFLV